MHTSSAHCPWCTHQSRTVPRLWYAILREICVLHKWAIMGSMELVTIRKWNSAWLETLKGRWESRQPETKNSVSLLDRFFDFTYWLIQMRSNGALFYFFKRSFLFYIHRLLGTHEIAPPWELLARYASAQFAENQYLSQRRSRIFLYVSKYKKVRFGKT